MAYLERCEAQKTRYYVPGICYQEVLQGAKDEKEWRILERYLGSQEILVPENPLKCHHEAARIFYLCRRKGITVRSTVDCLIAAMVREIDGLLLADDGDFGQIAGAISLRLA